MASDFFFAFLFIFDLDDSTSKHDSCLFFVFPLSPFSVLASADRPREIKKISPRKKKTLFRFCYNWFLPRPPPPPPLSTQLPDEESVVKSPRSKPSSSIRTKPRRDWSPPEQTW